MNLSYLKQKRKKKSRKKIGKSIKKQLQYISRDLEIVNGFLPRCKKLSERQENRLETIKTVYAQQLLMYKKVSIR